MYSLINPAYSLSCDTNCARVCVCVCVFPLGGALLHVPATTLTGLNKVAFSLITDQSVICRSRSDILLSLQIMLKLKKTIVCVVSWCCWVW